MMGDFDGELAAEAIERHIRQEDTASGQRTGTKPTLDRSDRRRRTAAQMRDLLTEWAERGPYERRLTTDVPLCVHCGAEAMRDPGQHRVWCLWHRTVLWLEQHST